MAVPEIGKKTIKCLKCGRPIMDKETFTWRKVCPSCDTVNRITLGDNWKVYQFEEPKEVTKKYMKEE